MDEFLMPLLPQSFVCASLCFYFEEQEAVIGQVESFEAEAACPTVRGGLWLVTLTVGTGA